jgi:hypothetical protein
MLHLSSMRVIIRANRLWIEIITLATGIACVLALVLATLGAVAAVLSAEPETVHAAEPIQAAPSQTASASSASVQSEQPVTQTHVGMVTCSKCQAKHSPALGQTAADCTRVCIANGGSFVLLEGDTAYRLEGGDLIAIKKLAGKRAQVVGVVNGTTIKISAIALAT